MFTGNPFKAIEIAEDDSSNSSAPDTIVEIIQGHRSALAKPTPPPIKTSRFSSLFEKNLAGPSTAFIDQAGEGETNAQVPRYKVPRNGQGAKMSSPSPPRVPGETYPKRLFVDNIPYAANKKDLIAFFDGYNVESITWQRKPGVTSGHSGAGYVVLGSEEEAKAAVNQLNGTVLKGRTVKVIRSKVASGGGRKSQPEFTYARQQSKPSGLQPKIQTVDSASYNGSPIGLISDSTSTLRKGIFDLACKSICNGGKTPDQIFQEVNFNDEEKIMIRDFYFRYKQAQKKAPELFSPNPMMDILEHRCTTHGLTQCMECHQTLLLQKIHQEEDHKENISSLTRAMHHHSLSWDSGATLHGGAYQPVSTHRNSMMTAPGQPLLSEATAYPPLTAASALRLYGPKFVRENFPQQEPPIHNTIGQVPRSGFMPGSPYSRQHAVVPTQPGVKTHCAYFLRTGRCDFAQQGCKFSHELPPGGQAELTLPPARRTVSSPPNFFANHNLSQLGGVVYPDVTQRLGPLPDIDLIESIAPVHGIPPLPISRGPRLTEGEFSLVPRGGGSGGIIGGATRATQPVFNRFQPLDDTPHVSARRRLASQPTQRQNSRPWRESSETRHDTSSWKQASGRQTGHHSETDGAADDEGSSEDLISLSSFSH
ncbi:hypothetical protein TWF225_007931 [Orbilia oligospora]|nr:hypothetical protein TWF225_007931 [Orbilia oligospora]KAF3248431.1 hypothetical protein TWF128_008413 [Orbilia oligospora]KAF3256575.1 hypothetical protein TWF217_006268 [Orbilia oligospora]